MLKIADGSSIIIRAPMSSTDYISLTGLSKEQIEKEKEQLIKQHVNKAIKGLEYTNNSTTKRMCESRLFFVEKDNMLILCGLYNISEKFYKVGPITKRYSQVCDYLLYSENCGLYFVIGCSAPFSEAENSLNTSPAIYFQSSINEAYELLEYGCIYQHYTLKSLQVKYNLRKYSLDDKMTYNFAAIIDDSIVHKIKNATLYSELPRIPNYYVYTTDKDHMSWLVFSYLIDFLNKRKYVLQLQEGFSFSHLYKYSYNTPLSRVLVDLYDAKRCIADDTNYYFYISRTDTVAYEEIMRKSSKFEKIERIENLLEFDVTVNYKITIPKEKSTEIGDYLFGIICKTNAMTPAILGCPIDQIVETLCDDKNINDPDPITTANTITLLQNHFGELPTWKIVKLIIDCYGTYAAKSQHSKYWMYYHGARLRESLDSQYIEELKKHTYSTKWVSEYSLYRLVYYYFPDAIMHYNAKWLGKQHLDIYIPSLSIGIEYQGQQHFEPNDFFGGAIGFDDRLFLDQKKRELCKENNIALIEWPYTMTINAANLIAQLNQNGISNIPTPDPFRTPNEYEEAAPEEKIAISIRQYNKEGKLICCYGNYNTASESSGASIRAIFKAIRGYNKTAGGYQWRRLLEGTPETDIEPISTAEKSGISKPILQVSLTGEIIGEYPSIRNAAKENGINSKSISSVLKGTQNTAGNYYWVYKENEQS